MKAARGLRLPVIATAVALVGACSSPGLGTAVVADPTNPFRSGHTLVIPHGGGDGLFPEDTVYAYEHSMALGGEVVDVDVALSADGIPVAVHDATVDATTNGTGSVASQTLAELQSLDAGYRFTIEDHQPFRGMGLRIPTLREILERFPDALVSLDLKDLGSDIIQPVCELLRNEHAVARSFVGSDGDDQIVELRRRCPDVRSSANLPDARALWKAADAVDPAFAPGATIDQPPYQAGGRTIVTHERLAYAHAHGVAVLTWVIDDEKTMKKLVEMGVDGIYTRYPDRLAKIVASYRKAHGR